MGIYSCRWWTAYPILRPAGEHYRTTAIGKRLDNIHSHIDREVPGSIAGIHRYWRPSQHREDGGKRSIPQHHHDMPKKNCAGLREASLERLRRFLGMVTFYMRHLPRAGASILSVSRSRKEGQDPKFLDSRAGTSLHGVAISTNPRHLAEIRSDTSDAVMIGSLLFAIPKKRN